MRLQFFLLPLLLVCAANFGPPASAKTTSGPDEVIAGIPRYFPPHYLIDEHGRPDGFAISTMDELARRANLKVTYRVFDTWPEVLAALLEEQVDLIPNVGVTERRRAWGQFSQPYESFRVNLYTRADGDVIRELGDLRGRTAGTAKGNIAEVLLPEYTGSPAKLYATPDALLQALLAEEIDVLAYAAPAMERIAGDAGMRDQIRSALPSLARVDRAILVAKSRADLLTLLAPHLAEFAVSAEFEEIYLRWFDAGLSASTLTWRSLASIAIGVMLAAGIALLWWIRRPPLRPISSPEQEKTLKRLWRRVVAIIALIAVITLAATALVMVHLYRVAFEQSRQELSVATESTGRFIEAVSRFDRAYSAYPEGPRAGTLAQIRDGLGGIEPAWETVIAQRAGDRIKLILRQRAARIEAPVSVPFDSGRNMAIRRALKGESGTMVDSDYRGTAVLTAFAPLPSLDLALVLQNRVADIRAPFIRAGWTIAPVAVAFSLLGGLAYLVLTLPIIRRVLESEERFAVAVRGTNDGLWDWDLKTDRVYYSPRWKSMLGYAEDEIADDLSEWRRLVHPQDAEPALARERGFIEGRVPDLRAEFRMRHKEGHWIHILSRGFGIWNQQGECVRLIGTHTDLTELRRAEERARDYARFPEEDPNPVLRVDRNGDVALANPAAQTLLADIAAVAHSESPRNYRQAWLDLMARAKSARQPETSEFEIGERAFLFHIVPAKDELQVNIYGAEITDRVRAEEALRTSEGRFRALIENVQDSIIVVDPGGTIRFRSPSARQLFGYESEETLGKDAFGFIHPDDRTAVAAEVAALAANPQGTAKAEFRVRRKDGSWRQCNVVGKNALTIPGIEGILLTVRDVTDEKRAEENLRKLSHAIEQSTNLVIITDRNGTIEYVNQAVERATGYTAYEAIGRTPGLWKTDNTPREVHKKLWQTITRGNNWHGEFENRHKDGTRYLVKATISPVRAPDGDITHFIAVEEDVTETRGIEEQLRQAQKMESIGQLTGGIAHDFNNLLMVITGNLELLEETLDRDSPVLKWARAARRASERGADLTARLLAFSRRQVLEPRRLDLNDSVRNVQDMLARTLGEDIDLQLHLADGLPAVILDPGQLEHALLNLAVNARDAMPDGGQLTIETTLTELDADYAQRHAEVTPGAYVMVAVTDTGTGMTHEQAERAFEPFFTTKESGRGTGLGLSMVYGFVKQSGGHAKIYSEGGQGTTVKLYFLCSEIPAETAAAVPAKSVGQAGGKECILVVEDDPDVRDILEAMLGQLGYRTIIANDGDEALRRLDETLDIDLLLTDVVMPGGMDGPQLADEVTARRPEIKVLFSSGYAEEALRRRGDYLEHANWIAKPYSRDHLARRLRDVLGTNLA